MSETQIVGFLMRRLICLLSDFYHHKNHVFRKRLWCKCTKSEGTASQALCCVTYIMILLLNESTILRSAEMNNQFERNTAVNSMDIDFLKIRLASLYVYPQSKLSPSFGYKLTQLCYT